MHGLTFELLGGDGGATSLGLVTEDPTIDQALPPKTVPPGGAPIFLRVTPGTQDAKVVTNFYRCGIQLTP